MATEAAVTIAAFVPHETAGAQLEALAELENAVLAEELPGEPPRDVAYYERLYRSIAAFPDTEFRSWWALVAGLPVAVAETGIRTAGDNPHLIFGKIKVAPAWRRRGVARRLLAEIVSWARAKGRRSFTTEIGGPEPLSQLPGAIFGRRIGAEPLREEHLNRLHIQDVDPVLLSDWREQGPRRSPDIELVWWDDGIPEDQLEAVASVVQVTSAGEPMDDLDMEPMIVNGAAVRAWMEAFEREGRHVHLLAARHAPSGIVAGYSMLSTDAANDRVLAQHGTGVMPEFRGRGLGKWLKAAMLNRVVELYPERREIRTGNADSNAAMLAINRKLGFRPWIGGSTWQVSIDEVERYLGGAARGGVPEA